MTSSDAAEVVVHAGREHGHDVTFVIVPGIGMSHRSSARLHDALARSGTVLSVDLPGFGGTPKPAGRMSVPDFAAAVARALDERRIGRAVLIGHSMGAQIAVELARRRPSLVERLVLAAPVVEPHRRTARQQSLDLLQDLMLETPSAAAIVIADYLRTGPRWFFTELRAMLAYRTEDAIGGVACPVLVVRGENDPIARHGWCYDLAHRAVDGELTEIAGAGHVLQHTMTEQVARAITTFALRDTPRLAAMTTRWWDRAGWWAKDYLTATGLLLSGLTSRADPRDYRSGDGRPCVVIPGVYETWHFLRPIAEALHEHGHPVFVVADLGHNRRPVLDSAELVARFVADQGLDDVFIAAHSKGGLIGKKYAMLRLDPDRRLVRMVAIATPFSGSRYANWAPNRTLRAFRANDPITSELAAEDVVNHRITSVYGAFDPIIPESSVPGAHNIELPTGGHFQILRHPRTLGLVVAEASAGPV